MSKIPKKISRFMRNIERQNDILTDILEDISQDKPLTNLYITLKISSATKSIQPHIINKIMTSNITDEQKLETNQLCSLIKTNIRLINQRTQ